MSQTPEERRSSLNDRRQQSRQGKYDRRKNRCGGCVFFDAEGIEISTEAGFCQKHQYPVTHDAFACLYFKSTGRRSS